MESLQLRVEVVAGGKHDGMGAMRLFDEEVAVSQKNLHRHKIVHEAFGCIRLKFTECTEDADLYHRNDTLQQSLETQGCQRIVIYNGEFGHRLACHCFLHFFVHHIADISVIVYRNGVRNFAANHPLNLCHPVRHSRQFCSLSRKLSFFSLSKRRSSWWVVHESTITAFSS